MLAPWRPAVAGLDLLIAVFASLNLAYFGYRAAARTPLSPPRRTAAAVLAAASLASLVEALALLAIGAGQGAGVLHSPPWLAVRALLLGATAAVSMLVLRRLLAR